MHKSHPDTSQPTATYRTPANVKEIVDDIVTRAGQTYPDHGESRNDMIRQELELALSDAVESRERMLNLCVSTADRMLLLHQKLVMLLGG